MKPVNYPIHIYQGSSWHLKTTFKDPDGNPIDLSAYEGEMQIRRDVAASDALITLDQTSGLDLNSNAEFNLIATLTMTQTEDLPTNNQEIEDWVYDIRIWEAASPETTAIRLVEGRVFVSPAVTRDSS